MTQRSQQPVFLQRASYRQRRLRDAAKMMPFLGAILLIIPLAWPAEQEQAPSNTAAVIYIFAVWVVLIVISAGLAARIRSDRAAQDRPKDQS